MKCTVLLTGITSLLAALALSACGGAASDSGLACTIGGSSGCGGSGSPTTPNPPTTPPAPDPGAAVTTLSLVMSGNELPSSGSAELTVTALVSGAGNAALAGVPVRFEADSGLLSSATASSDAKGQARVTLGYGGARSNRNITVTARLGERLASALVSVVGTSVAIAGPAVLPLGGEADLTLTLRDAAGQPIAGAPVTFNSRNGNSLAVRQGAPALTDSQGRLALTLSAQARGNELLTVTAMGASASKSVLVEGSDLRIAPAVGSAADGSEQLLEVATGVCQTITVSSGAGADASVTLGATRGSLYTDAGCSKRLTGNLTVGPTRPAQAYISSANAGVATLTAAAGNGPEARSRIEFVAPLTAAARISLQAETPLLSNSPGASRQSTLTAVVRDGSPANNLVRDARVLFTLIGDPSGGTLLAPVSVLTGPDGAAQVQYQAGPADSGRDGVQVEARIAGLTGAQARGVATLTVSQRALSIQFGTGNSLATPSPSLLQQEYTVLLSDAAGNPVPGVSVAALAWAPRYAKGFYTWTPDQPPARSPGVWIKSVNVVCLNEDRLRNGVYDAAFDLNGNGVFEPGLPLTVGVGGLSDAQGLARLTVNYPRDRASWLQAELTVRATVAGTESRASTLVWLPQLSADLHNADTPPPGSTSPYGAGACSSAN